MYPSRPGKIRRRHRRPGFLARVALATFTCANIAEAGNRIVFDSLRPLVTTRLDPIVFPGAISQHIHRVVGGNNFNSVYDAKVFRNSTCSSMAPQADMSNYWHPTLYKVILQPDGSSKYSPMWGQTRIYYHFPSLKKGTGPGTYVEPFPESFEMVAGNPAKKTGGGYTQEDLSVFYYCERDFKNGTVVGYSTYDLPKFGCSFLTTKVWFPSCWNGQPFDPSNPYGHVKYPDLGAGLVGPNCPVGYERRIPGILVETFYFGYGTNGWMQWYQGPGDEFGGNGNLAPTYILANGDTTGYGLHADFANGWNQTVLQQVVTECLDTDGDLRTDQACPPLAPSWNQAAANNCHLSTNTKVPNEVVGWDSPLDALPGCNLPWASGMKPTCAGYKERRWADWGRLIGPELNEEPTLAEVANDPFGLNASASTIITSNTQTSASTTTSMSLDTDQTTLTIPTTVISVPSTTIISDASPTLIIDTAVATTGSVTSIMTTTGDVSLTRGQDGTTIVDSSSSTLSSTDLTSTMLNSTVLTSTTVDSIATTTTKPSVTTTSKAATTTSKTATTTGKASTNTSKAATTTSKAATTITKAGTTTSKIPTTTSKAGSTTSKVNTTTSRAATTTSKATATTSGQPVSSVSTTSKAASAGTTTSSQSIVSPSSLVVSSSTVSSSSSSTVSVSTSTSRIVLAPGRGAALRPTTTLKPSTTSKVTVSTKASSSSVQAIPPPASSSTSVSSASSVPVFSSTTVGLALARGRVLPQSPMTSITKRNSVMEGDESTSPADGILLTSYSEDDYPLPTTVSLKPVRGIITT